MSEQINGWVPPVITETENYQRRGRVVTQVDVDRWIAIEHKYSQLVHLLREAGDLIGNDA